jgi:hypothetical protein
MIGFLLLRSTVANQIQTISAAPQALNIEIKMEEANLQKVILQQFDINGATQFQKFVYTSYTLVGLFTGAKNQNAIGDSNWFLILFLEKADLILENDFWEPILKQWAKELLPIYNYLKESKSKSPDGDDNDNILDSGPSNELNFNDIIKDRVAELRDKIKDQHDELREEININFQLESQNYDKISSDETQQDKLSSKDQSNLNIISRIEKLTVRFNKTKVHAMDLLEKLINARNFIIKQATTLKANEKELLEKDNEIDEKNAIIRDQKMIIEDKELLLTEKNEKLAALLVADENSTNYPSKFNPDNEEIYQQLLMQKKENKVLQRDIINLKKMLDLE